MIYAEVFEQKNIKSFFWKRSSLLDFHTRVVRIPEVMILFLKHVFFITALLCSAAEHLCGADCFSEDLTSEPEACGFSDMHDVPFGELLSITPVDSEEKRDLPQTILQPKENDGVLDRQDSADAEKERKEDVGLFWKSARKKRKINKRAGQLLDLLKARVLYFEEVQSTLYGKLTRSAFQMDILKLMHNGADIYKTDGGYRCYGQLRNYSMPSESVANAMFSLLLKGVRSIFELKFQLYRLGYRAYPSEFLENLEIALTVADVHPCSRKVASAGMDVCSQIKEVWGTLHKLSYEAVDLYLRSENKEKADILKKKRYVRVIQRLWDLQAEGDLAVLQKRLIDQKALTQQNYAGNLQGLGTRIAPRMPRQEKIMSALGDHLDEEISVQALLSMVDLPKARARGVSSFLQAVLPLALGDRPIVYNKDNQTVMLSSAKIQQEKPKENTNLLTMLYDLIQKHNGDLLPEEIAYYAHRGGYWLDGFDQGCRRRFYERVNRYKSFLATLGYISTNCCGKQREDVFFKKKLWQHQDTLMTQEDRDFVDTVNTFTKSPEFCVFLRHFNVLNGWCIPAFAQPKEVVPKTAPALTCADYIIGGLRHGAVSKHGFFSMCALFGVTTESGMWAIAGELTSRQSGGRLLYNSDQESFYWDSRGWAPYPQENELVATVLDLKSKGLSHAECFYMLKQKRFRNVTIENIDKILHGLAVLNLYSLQNDTVTKARDILHSLGEGVCPGFPVDESGRTSQAWKIVQDIFSWKDNGSMCKLNEMTLLAQKEKDEPPAKRQKLHTVAQN